MFIGKSSVTEAKSPRSTARTRHQNPRNISLFIPIPAKQRHYCDLVLEPNPAMLRGYLTAAKRTKTTLLYRRHPHFTQFWSLASISVFTEAKGSYPRGTE